jgi:glycerate kinase
MVEVLDQGLQNYALVVKRQYNIDIGSMSGAGAAGGLGGGFVGFLKAKLKPGVDIIFSKLELEKKAQNADIIITGEGKMDFQSVMGKAPMGVAKIGKRLGIPVIGIAGTVTEEAYQLHEYGITALFSILNAPLTLSEAMDNTRAKRLIEDNIREIFRLIKMKV